MKTLNSLYLSTRKFFLGFGLTALFFVASCTQDAQSPSGIDEAAVEAESVMQADFEEVDDISANSMVLADPTSGGKFTGIDDDRLGCATVTHNKELQVITIDFGDGCTGPRGVTRSGKIIITYTGRRLVPGSSWIITFDDYYVNGRHIEGIRTLTNISASLEDNPTFHVTLIDGKITWPDNTFATREVDRTRVWIRANNPILDEVHILEGSVVSGLNREGVNYQCTVLSDLVFKRNCRDSRKTRVPVQGTKEVIKGDKTYTLDFGDGECDSIITVTGADGTRTIDLSGK